MKKEISPELYNYNKFPGPVFARVEDKVVSEDIVLDVVTDYRSAFDQTAFGQRFSPLLLKFDYIVGDWGNEQLRLRGFYRDDRKVKAAQKISYLDEYLIEYCNFGCAYFVLENPNPQEMPVEKEERPRRRRRRKSTNNHQQDKNASQERHFSVTKKETSERKLRRNEPTPEQRNRKKQQKRRSHKNQEFTIRKK